MDLGRAGNGRDPGLLSQHPGEGDLRARDALAACELSHELDEGLVRLPAFRRESRQGIAEVRAVELRVLVDGACEEAPAERAVGDEADAELLEHREYLALGLPPPQGILVLQRRDRLDRVRATDALHA